MQVTEHWHKLHREVMESLSFLRDTQKLPGHASGELAVCGLDGAGDLDQMISTCHFHPEPFCDPVRCLPSMVRDYP